MIPESLKIGHWLSKVPLPFATNPPGSRKPTKATRCTWDLNMTPDWRHAMPANTSGYGSVFYKVGTLQVTNEVIVITSRAVGL